jgi:hypothetical protein
MTEISIPNDAVQHAFADALAMPADAGSDFFADFRQCLRQRIATLLPAHGIVVRNMDLVGHRSRQIAEISDSTPLNHYSAMYKQTYTIDGAFCFGYGFDEYSLGAVDYVCGGKDSPSLLPFRTIRGFSIGNIAFNTETVRDVRIASDQAFRAVAVAWHNGTRTTPRPFLAFLGVHFDFDRLQPLLDNVIATLPSDYLALDEVQSCSTPVLWIARESGALYTCRCFDGTGGVESPGQPVFQPLLSVRSAGNKYANYGPGTSVDHWEFHEVEGSKIDVWTNTYRPNNGTNGYDLLPPTACAKNQLVVGAIYKNTNGYVTTNDIILADFSAVGPTDDGRIKPDIVAPGVEISTTKNTSFSAYSTNENGTSFAAPAVAGSLNLIRKQHEDIFGTNQMILSSSLRALAIHTATPATTNGAPDYRHGWGAFNAEACAELVKYNEKDVPTPEALGIPPSSIETNMEIYVISPILYASSNSIESYYDSPDGPMIRSVAVNYNLGTNETRAGLQYVKDFLLPEGEEINFPVTPLGGEPLMVTIAWSDYPGTPPSAIVNPTNLMLVNDLDLRLISPSGTTNFPWVLDPANPSAPATKGDNFRDNVEKVLIENPEAGEYTVMVTHKGELEQGHQFVSMVLSGHQPDEWSAPGLYNVTPYPIDNMMTVGWNAIPGFSYYIMARTNMIFGNWNSLAVVNALTDQMEVTIPLYTNTLYFTLGGGQSGVYQ